MTFQARKTREKKAPAPMARGRPIRPNAGIRDWYYRAIMLYVRSMIENYKKKINSVIEQSAVKKFFAQDSHANDIFQKTLDELNDVWTDVFAGVSKNLAEEFVGKVDQGVTTATFFSLKVAGVQEPTKTYTENVKSTLGAAVDYNSTLITGIQKEVHEKIYSAVMLSLTSPNPEEQGIPGIKSALESVGISAKRRVELITEDQTSKLYSSLAIEQMEENGCEELEWVHSHAGKVPRKTHIEKDGKIFRINDPRFWEGSKSDQGPPGWAIGCGCTAIPVFR